MTIRFDAIGFVVNNMTETLRFYRLLGLEIPRESDEDGHVEAVLPGGIRIMWDTVEMVQSFSSWEPPSGGHRVALAFLCENAGVVDSKHAEMVEAGYRSHLAPFDAFWGQRYATILDPDANPVDLFASLQQPDV